MPILASSMFPNAYGKAGAVITTANPLVSQTINTGQTSTQDIYVVKYSSIGKALWAARVVSTGNNESGYAISSDTSGNVYVTGQYSNILTAYNADGTSFLPFLSNSGSNDVFVVKYNTNGVVQWLTRIASTGDDIGYSIATDTSGNVYVTGQGGSGVTITAFNANGSAFGTTIANAGLNDAFIVKYNTNGAVQWVARVASSAADVGVGIATDTSGNVYVTGQGGTGAVVSAFSANGTAFGTTLANSGGTDAFIVKYDTNGTVQWVARVASSAADIGFAIATDTSGNVYVTGQGGTGAVVSAFSANGTAFGTTLANAGGTDAFIVKYDTNGAVQWVARVASTAADIGYGIATDSAGNVYVTGQGGTGVVVSAFSANGTAFGTTLPNSGGTDIFIVKYDTNGAVQWVARVASSAADIGYSISVDSGGNLYVTGSFGLNNTLTAFNANGTAFGTTLVTVGYATASVDSFIVKYNTNGTVQWLARLASNFNDVGRGICVDQSGNVYTTGSFIGRNLVIYGQSLSTFSTIPNSGGTDAFIIKYNATAVPQWVARIASVGSDSGFGVANDSLGNVYVIGDGGGTVTGFNANGTAFATTLANSGGTDVFLVKYDTNGAVQWVTNIASVGTDTGRSISTDSAGNVYVTGGTGGATTAFNADGSSFATTLADSGLGDAFIVKYNTNGFVQWVAKIASAQNEIGYGVATDTLGNVYVTGVGGTGVTITAFNANGTSFATTLPNSGSNDAFIVKYNTNGTVQWVARVASTGSDNGFGIVTDTSGNVYVTGQYTTGTATAFNANGTAFGTTLANAGGTDAFIVKYDTNGAVQWVTRIAGTGNEIGQSIFTDSLGNIYITGQSGAAATTLFSADGTTGSSLSALGANDAFIAKYNTNGVFQWASSIGGASADIGYSIAVDGTGNVYATFVGGIITVTNSDSTFFVNLPTCTAIVKFDTNGFGQWAQVIATPTTNFPQGRGLILDSTGNICVCGTTRSGTSMTILNTDMTPYKVLNTSGTFDAFVVKYSPNTTPLWAAKIGGAAASLDLGLAVATDSSGNVYVSGLAGGSGTTAPVRAFNADGTAFASSYSVTFGGDAFIVKYNTNGVVQWLARVGVTLGDDYGWGIATDSSGNVYMAGQHSPDIVTAYNANGTAFATTLPSAGGQGAFIVKYDTNGAVQWLVRLASISDDLATAISVDTSGNVYATGQLGNTFTAYNANGTAFGTTVPTAGGADVFIVKYNTNGVVQWLTRIGGAGNDVGYGIRADGSGNVYVTGQGGANNQTVTAYNSDGTAFGTTLANAGGSDVFIAKYNTSGVVQWLARVASTGTDIGWGIAIDSAGNSYVTGQGGDGTAPITAYNSDGTAFATTLSVNAGFNDAFIVKYNTNGTVQWIARIASTRVDIGYSVATDTAGDVYVLGQFGNGTVAITPFNADGTSPLGSSIIVPLGQVAVVKYNSSGVVQWLSLMSADIGRQMGIALDSSNNIYATGNFQNSAFIASDA